MVDRIIRKKSPRAPGIPLNDALDKALKVYDKERLHPAPIEVVANNMGYKNANNGAALTNLAALRYFSLLERSKDGFLAVNKDLESFRFAPDEQLRKELLIKFLKQPPLYSELLEHYPSGLPSDATLKYDLIQRGFTPSGAESVLSAFKDSVSFAGFYESSNETDSGLDGVIASGTVAKSIEQQSSGVIISKAKEELNSHIPSQVASVDKEGLDRIPVRLSGGRRAWLLIPTPFYAADANRLKAQIDLLLMDDDDHN